VQHGNMSRAIDEPSSPRWCTPVSSGLQAAYSDGSRRRQEGLRGLVSGGSQRRDTPGLIFAVSVHFTVYSIYDDTFEIIYLLNVFYLFERQDQLRCLQELRGLADDRSLLVLFDYTAKTPNGRTESVYRTHWHPIDTASFPPMSEAAGWNIAEFVDYSNRYGKWYAAMLEKLHEKHDAIVEIANESWFDEAKRIYESHLEGIESGRLGGGVYYLRSR
jgi:hypothetical protein